MKSAARYAVHAALATVTVTAYVIVVVPTARARAFIRRRHGRAPAILWGPTPVVNVQYAVRADRLYGYKSESLVYRVYGIDNSADFDHVLERWTSKPLVGRVVPYLAALWAGLKFDIFGCFFDGALLAETPFWRVELPLLRLAGKRIVVYPYGGDARLASRTREIRPWNAFTDVPLGAEDRDERDVHARLEAFGRWADTILGNNDLVEDLPRLDGVLPYPFDSADWVPVVERDDGVVTVVHASNHRHYKGTRFVINAVEQLRAEGLPVELILVEGVPRSAAKAIYERADIIAADFLIGGYAYFAIEGMALGKPVLSYLNERFAAYHPEWAECPIVNASPATLVTQLRRLALDFDLRRTLGDRGPAYVRKVHSLESVGAQLDRIYRQLWSLPNPLEGDRFDPTSSAC